MSAAMEILPVLTPLFLEYQPRQQKSSFNNHKDDEKEQQQRCSPRSTSKLSSIQHYDAPATPSAPDNTHKYLTDRWLATTSNPSNDDHSPMAATSTTAVSLSPMMKETYDFDAVPMWISPTVSHSYSATPGKSSPTLAAMLLSPNVSMPMHTTAGSIPAMTMTMMNATVPPSLPPPPFMATVSRGGEDPLPSSSPSPPSKEVTSLRHDNDVPSVIFVRTTTTNNKKHNFEWTVAVVEGGGGGAADHSMTIDHDFCGCEDAVSVLADNPDDDDVGVLPHATYDVLASIFDEIYKDDSAVVEKEDTDTSTNHHHHHDGSD